MNNPKTLGIVELASLGGIFDFIAGFFNGTGTLQSKNMT